MPLTGIGDAVTESWVQNLVNFLTPSCFRLLHQDYWHHVEDVVAGFLLGATFSYAFYRQQYPAICSTKGSGEPYVTSQPSVQLADWSLEGPLAVRGIDSNTYLNVEQDRTFGRDDSAV